MDIEEKVLLIKEEILEETRQEKNNMVAEEKKKWDSEYKEFQKGLKTQVEEITLNYKREAILKKEKIISGAILGRKKSRRRCVDKCINKFINELKDRLQEFSTKAEYIDFLIKSVKSSIKLLNGNDFIIKIRKSDLSITEKFIKQLDKELADYNFTIKESQRAKSGGVIVEKKDGNEIVEYTFDTVIKYLKEDIAIEIQKTVFI